jgi:hypothetical protein
LPEKLRPSHVVAIAVSLNNSIDAALSDGGRIS